ncbi:MAG: N-formylglutamate amidohydrolase [Planctomycetota bacterium]
MRPEVLLLSAEHGGNRIPARWAHLFASRAARAALAGHRGSDPGSLAFARFLARSLGAPLVATTTSRLLVEVNRSPGHPRLWSEWTRDLDPDDRRAILAAHYEPHRRAVEDGVRAALARAASVLHLSVHSFVPVLDGVARTTEVGLLYDPARGPERRFCTDLAAALRVLGPELRVHRNRPYRGAADGLTTWLRRRFPAGRYLGVELELRQDLLAAPATRRRLEAVVRGALGQTLGR